MKNLASLLPTVIKVGKAFFNILKEIFSETTKKVSEENMKNNESVVNITEELNNLNKKLKSSFSEIEDEVQEKIENILQVYLDIVSTLKQYSQVKKSTILRLEKEINKYEGFFKNDLEFYLNRNISIDNNELIQLLKLGNSDTKQRMIQEFISSSIRKSLTEYSQRVSLGLSEISEKILDEFSEVLFELEEEIKQELISLNRIEENITNSKEKERFLCEKISEKVLLETLRREDVE